MTKDRLLSLQVDKTSKKQFFELKKAFDYLKKPLDGLGKFEDIICKIGCAQHTINPCIDNKTLIVMCADNGILEEGVTERGGFVTGLTAKSIAEGKSGVSFMAKKAGVDVIPVDIGINGDIDHPDIVKNKIAKGTKNFLKEPAMSMEQVIAAIDVGIKLVESLKNEGCDIVLAGEVGVANSTSAAALICAMLEGDPSVLTGRGAGLSNSGFARKLTTVFEALSLYGYDKDDIGYETETENENESDSSASVSATGEREKALEMLMNVGGLDIAGLVGVYIGAALHHIPAVVDGVISAAAALVADAIVPGCRQYMVASHIGTDPAIEIVLQELELDPTITSNICMGEGAGAIMLMPILDMVIEVFNKLGSYEDIGLEPQERY